ncbi:hypothetical protein [Spongiactinospora gelatinilytica]|uniref:hypothetical protein n=1 Tax=Spongiactinospora gelatinilytica TaxID=2666298 RepID=UPI000DA76537|nr:hypothetical protein [Spongiactinospora gelatinilytica]
MRELNAKRTKTVDDRVAIARVEFEGGMYYQEGIGPYIPAENLFRSLVNGARLIRAGKKVERGVFIATFMLPLLYEGPRDIDALWGSGLSSPFVYLKTVTIAKSKVDRCRPIFHKWAIEAEVLLDPEIIELEEFAQIAQLAGEKEGIGDYRSVFGRYRPEIEKL